MEDTGQKEVARAGRGIKLLLAVSLALNLAFVGFVAGAAWRHDREPEGGARAPGLSAFGAPYMLALPREERRAVLRAMRDSSDQPLPDRSERRQIFREVLQAIRATPFEIGRLKTAVATQADVSVAVQRRAQDAWLEVIAGMDDAERAAYAAAIEEGMKRRLKRR